MTIPMNLCSIQDQCGGCPRMSEPLAEQRAHRIERVSSLLGVPVTQLIESPETEGYRSRIELTPGPEGHLGYRSRRSHTSISVERCVVARPEINALLSKVGTVPAYIHRIAFRSNGQAVAMHIRCKDKFRKKAQAWVRGLEHLGVPLALNGKGVFRDPSTRIEVCGVLHQLSPSTFYQVNLPINEQLVRDVVDTALSFQPTAVLDLYSGAGNFSLPIAKMGVPVTLVEAHPAATKDARRTIAQLGVNAEIQTVSADRFRAGDAFFDVAILDPPRKGAGPVLDQVLTTRPRAVILVSCNPQTLASDLNRAQHHGYHMSGVRLYEMFPHTDHVETMGVLVRD